MQEMYIFVSANTKHRMLGQHQTDGSEIREKLPPTLHLSGKNHNHSSAWQQRSFRVQEKTLIPPMIASAHCKKGIKVADQWENV